MSSEYYNKTALDTNLDNKRDFSFKIMTKSLSDMCVPHSTKNSWLIRTRELGKYDDPKNEKVYILKGDYPSLEDLSVGDQFNAILYPRRARKNKFEKVKRTSQRIFQLRFDRHGNDIGLVGYLEHNGESLDKKLIRKGLVYKVEITEISYKSNKFKCKPVRLNYDFENQTHCKYIKNRDRKI